MFTFDNSTIRRQDRLMPEGRAKELLQSGEYGFLALSGDNGGYGIPLNYVYEDGHIYFHCAPHGEKLLRIQYDDRASFCIVGATEVQPASFTTEYESVMTFGYIATVTDDAERMHALELLVMKYSPEHLQTGLAYASKSLHRTVILKIVLNRFSGKCKVSHK